MTNKFTDARIALLRSGFQRVDHCIVAPTGKGASAKKSAAKMIEVGWLKEIKSKSGAPVWRTDEATGTTYSLKLTALGMKFIAAEISSIVTPPSRRSSAITAASFDPSRKFSWAVGAS